MTLKFKDWNSLNEAGLFDQIKNWLSSTFGGSIDALDKLANEYRSAELEYVEKTYPDVYTGGVDELSVVWVVEGTQFYIEEYDGRESLMFKDTIDWISA